MASKLNCMNTILLLCDDDDLLTVPVLLL